MQKVETEPLVREDKKALVVLNIIRWTVNREALDSGGLDFYPYLADRLWLRPHIPKDVIFVLGGCNGGTTSNLLTYNPCSRRRVFQPCLYTTLRAYHGVAMLNGLIYFIGGFDGRNYRTVVFLDVQGCEWTTKSNMHTARSYVSVALLDGYIYAMGGFDGENCALSCKSTVYRTTSGSSWRPCTTSSVMAVP